jgi:Protein of unknown function, DUF481
MMGSLTQLVPIGRSCLLAIRRPPDARAAHLSASRVPVHNRRALNRPAFHRDRRPSGKNEFAMNIRAIPPGLILVSTLFLATPGFARNKNDVVVMKNGDRLTCEIKGLDDGVLSVSLDYVDGPVSLQWSKVAHLESAQEFIIKTQDGSVHSGTLLSTEAVAAQPMKIQIEEKGSKTAVIEARQVVKITQTSERFWQRFNGAIDFGLDHSKGNDATQYSLGAETSYIRERWAATSSFNSNLSANSGSTTSTRQQVDIGAYHLLPWNNYFYAGIGNFLQSSVQGITLQTSVGGGIGRFFKNTNRVTIAVTAGLAWQNAAYQPSFRIPEENTTAALIAGQLKVFKFKKTNLSLTTTVFPALSQPGRVRYGTNASYYLKLFNNLSWNISFYGNWDNVPPHHLSGSDYGSSSGLRWTFGNE